MRRALGRAGGEEGTSLLYPLAAGIPWTAPTPPALKTVLKSQGHSDRVDRPLKTAKCHACGTGPQVCPASSKKCILPPPRSLPWLFPPTLMHILLCQHQACSVLFPLPDTFAVNTPATDHLYCPLTHLSHLLFGTFDHPGEKLGTVVAERCPASKWWRWGSKPNSPTPNSSSCNTKAKQGQEAEGCEPCLSHA